MGLAKGHRANPAATLKAHQIYCLPVLLSGTAALILKSTEVQLIEQHLKDTLSNLQKLMPRTSPCVVYFLGGHLPATALLHLRQLSLFGMVCHLKDSVLYQIAEYQLTTCKLSSGSWFMKIRELCLQYQLPTPLTLLYSPPPKPQLKTLVKSLVIDYWEVKLRAEAAPLDSLRYFHPHYMSLVKPHPIWTTCNANPFEVNKAVIQARMLSGRYFTDQLARHWNQNKAGICLLKGCSGQSFGSLDHILLQCPALLPTRKTMINFCLDVALQYPPVKEIIASVLSTKDHLLVMQFLLDSSTLPEVIKLVQSNGPEPINQLFYATRNWCYSVHRKRMDLLGLYQFR